MKREPDASPAALPAPPARGSSRAVLDPVDRFSEVLYGVIMAVSMIGSVRVGGDEESRLALLRAALGANVAWGLVDAVMYVIGAALTRGRSHATERAIRAAPDAASGRRVLGRALPPAAAAALSPGDLEAIRARIAARPGAPRPAVRWEDLAGAAAVFALVALSTLPVSLPFLLLRDARTALRLSNGVAVGLLFLAGAALGRSAGFGAWRTGITTMLVGAGLVAVIASLGG